MVSNKNPFGYLNEIKDRFEMDLKDYDRFLDIMLDFEGGRMSPDDLLGRIRELFKGHKTLISGFNDFLPVEKQIILTEDETALCFINKVKTRFGDDQQSYTSFLRLLEMYTKGKKSIIEVYEEIAFLFRNHHDLLVDFRDFLPDTSLGINKKRKIDYNAAKKSRSHTYSVESYSVQASSSSNSDFNCLKGIDSQEFTCFEKVKDRRDEDQLTKYMELYRHKIVTRSELQTLVDELIENNPKLQRKFNKFLEESEKIGFGISKRSVEGSEISGENVALGGENATPNKYTGKSIQDLDFSECERISFSYRRLPEDFPVAISKKTEAHVEGVLNHKYVCVPSGSNGFSYGNKRKTPIEEEMFRLEDARFEIDMFIGALTSTSMKVEILLEAMERNMYGTSSVLDLKDHKFTDQDLRCIENLYGDYGLEMLELLKYKAACALPIILGRLIQKKEEWTKFSSDPKKSDVRAQCILRKSISRKPIRP